MHDNCYKTEKFQYLPAAAFHPSRDFAYQAELHEIERVAALLGITLMPWQRKAIDVATQFTIDHRGRRVYKYTHVLITVPRQSGKTTLMGPVQIHRMMTRGVPAACWYTAQSGQDARKRIIELIELVEGSPMAAVISSQRSNGGEGLRLTDKPGCHVTRFSPTYSALHGEHPHLVSFDEIWHYDKQLGEALLGAAEPAQITLGKAAQVWMFSTMGTLESDFMNELVETGRTGADPNLCYIEYSVPEGADAFDPAVWWSYHPALGNTIEEDSLQVRATKALETLDKRATFIRAYGNRLGAGAKSIIDLSKWDELPEVTRPPEDKTKAVISYEIAPKNTAAAVVISWQNPGDAAPSFQVYKQNPGTAWVVPTVRKLAKKWGAKVVADGAGPVQRLTETLIDPPKTPEHQKPIEPIDVRTLSMAEYGQATESLLNIVATEQKLNVPAGDAADTVREQLELVQVKTTNGVRRFSRDTSPAPVHTLIATAVGLYALEHPVSDSVPPLALPY